MNDNAHIEQGTVAPGSALHSGLIPKWYRYALAGITVVLVLVAVLAGGAFREATIRSCEGANDAKLAVTRIVDQLYAASTVPSDNPDIAAARAANAERYAKLQAGFHNILAPEDCGTLIPWDTGE